MRSFVLLNGPSGVGKDTAADIIHAFLADEPTMELHSRLSINPVWEKFSMPNKRAFAAIVGKEVDWKGNVDYFEKHKEEPFDFLGGKSYRNWQQDFSMKFMKPLYGEDILGRLLLQRIARFQSPDWHTVVVVSDCGFQIEADTLRDEHVLLINLEREGKTYEGDIRQEVNPPLPLLPGWEQVRLWNDGTIDELRPFLLHHVLEHILRRPS